MKIKTQTRTEQILTVMHILAWVAFIGFLIQAGVFLLSYTMTWFNPDAAKNVYRGLNLYSLSQSNFRHYTLSMAFLIALAIMKACVSFLFIKVLSKVNLVNPFKIEVSIMLERISYVLFATWVLAMLHNAHTGWLLRKTGAMQGDWVTGEFIFIAAIVFVISQIFKRGVEIQSENELTV